MAKEFRENRSALVKGKEAVLAVKSFFSKISGFYHIYSIQMHKIPTVRKSFKYSFYYLKGTLLSFKFEKRSFIYSRGKKRIERADGGVISVDNFVTLLQNVQLSVLSHDPMHPAKLSIGAMTYIAENTAIHCGERVTIGKHVLISADCIIMDRDFHPIPGNSAEKVAPVIIEDNVWIGYRCIVLKGVTIGHGAVVGAGSVVTKNVPPCTIAAGNPAKVVKEGLPDLPVPNPF